MMEFLTNYNSLECCCELVYFILCQYTSPPLYTLGVFWLQWKINPTWPYMRATCGKKNNRGRPAVCAFPSQVSAFSEAIMGSRTRCFRCVSSWLLWLLKGKNSSPLLLAVAFFYHGILTTTVNSPGSAELDQRFQLVQPGCPVKLSKGLVRGRL